MTIIATISLIPFFGWGLFSLIRRYRYHEESSALNEIVSLLGLIAFFGLESNLLRGMLDSAASYIFSLLGLFVAGAALYGHIIVAFMSRLIIDVVSSDGTDDRDRPRFGPIEALEYQGDYESALQEYLVMARIFPHDASVYARMAQCQLQLEDAEGAVTSLRHGLKRVRSAEKAFVLTSRLVEILDRHLDDAAGAAQALAHFADTYPDCEEANTARGRMDNVGERHHQTIDAALESLDEVEVEIEEPMEIGEEDVAPVAMGLDALEDGPPLHTEEVGVESEPESEPVEEEEEPAPTQGSLLTAMEDNPLPPVEEDTPEETPYKQLGLSLVSLDDAPLEHKEDSPPSPDTDKAADSARPRSSLLEAMDDDLEAH